jgi:hypothetical protein
MRWSDRLTMACMVATVVVAVVYNERNYRLATRNAEMSAEQLRLAKEYAERQAEMDAPARRIHERREAGESGA